MAERRYHARDVLVHPGGNGEMSLREYELTEELARDTGRVCGGTMRIWVEPGERALKLGDRELLGDVLAASTGGRPVALATLLRKTGRDFEPAGRLFVESDGRVGGSSRMARSTRAPERSRPTRCVRGRRAP